MLGSARRSGPAGRTASTGVVPEAAEPLGLRLIQPAAEPTAEAGELIGRTPSVAIATFRSHGNLSDGSPIRSGHRPSPRRMSGRSFEETSRRRSPATSTARSPTARSAESPRSQLGQTLPVLRQVGHSATDAQASVSTCGPRRVARPTAGRLRWHGDAEISWR